MNEPLVIGFGNPLREDDGLGWKAAELVEARTGGAARVIVCHQLTPELAADLARAPHAIFLDASLAEAPGTVREIAVSPADGWSCTHHLTPAQLLAIALELGGTLCPSVLITGGAYRTGTGEQLTPAAEQCARRMAELACRILARRLPHREPATSPRR